MRICIVGGGIIGLSSALCIQSKYPNFVLTLISEKFSPNTTGDGAAGLWTPYLLQNTSQELIYKWSKDTHDFFLELWKRPEGGVCGISLIPLYSVVPNDIKVEENNEFSNGKVPKWTQNPFGFHKMSSKELQSLNIPNLKSGESYVTFTCEPSKLLPYFLKKFTESGGRVVNKRIESLKDLSNEGIFDVIVNCTGVEAKYLANDDSVSPISGQVMRVSSGGIFSVIMNENGNYIIPNQDSVVLGGTHEDNDWSTNINREASKFILSGCSQMIPSLKDSEILNEWVGLRPKRSKGIRIESESMYIRNKKIHIIHNYGHGGSGITLCWGTALETVKLLDEIVKKSIMSKL